MTMTRRCLFGTMLAVGGSIAGTGGSVAAPSARVINQQADQALRQLYAQQPKARAVGRRAKAILIFPGIIKAGLLLGGQSGNGVLFVGGRTAGYYNLSAASFGLQAGGQKFSYALFFMTNSALGYLQKSDGWAIGSGPSVVVVDKGVAASLNTTTLAQDVYAFPFGQQGLMAGLGLEGSKITRIYPRQ
jgi:lipid-binding SYLF domain-containing protein